MTQPLIAITARIEENTTGNPPLNGARQPYLEAIKAAGGIPLIIPILEDAHGVKEIMSLVSGLVLPGGTDILPQYYNEEALPCMGRSEPARDVVELLAVEIARKRKMPVLGICRGIQLLNVAYGGTLYQDINIQRPELAEHPKGDWQDIMHKMQIAEDSRLFSILKEKEVPVNSLHHQAIKDLAKDLVAVGYTEDSLIEAVETKDKDQFVIGIQCHPEVLWQNKDNNWIKLFEAFVNAAKNL